MILDINQAELEKHFNNLVALVEAGNHFSHSNPQHVTWLKKRISRHFYAGVRFFAAFEENDRPIGFAGVLVPERLEGVPFGRSTELLLIGVQEEYRGQGYGKMLLEHAEKLSRESGAYCMYIATYARDSRNIAFYGHHGYIPVATLPDVNGPGDDGNVYMRKIIAEN
jgi:GNAT superfamily N-acetyltransferase